MLRKGFIAFASLALAACATQPTDGSTATTAASNDCFRSEDAHGFTMADEHHIRVHVGASRNYILGTTWNARDLNWTEALAIRSATGRICTGNGLGVEVIGGEPRRTYPITSIERAPDDTPPAQGS